MEYVKSRQLTKISDKKDIGERIMQPFFTWKRNGQSTSNFVSQRNASENRENFALAGRIACNVRARRIGSAILIWCSGGFDEVGRNFGILLDQHVRRCQCFGVFQLPDTARIQPARCHCQICQRLPQSPSWITSSPSLPRLTCGGGIPSIIVTNVHILRRVSDASTVGRPFMACTLGNPMELASR